MSVTVVAGPKKKPKSLPSGSMCVVRKLPSNKKWHQIKRQVCSLLLLQSFLLFFKFFSSFQVLFPCLLNVKYFEFLGNRSKLLTADWRILLFRRRGLIFVDFSSQWVYSYIFPTFPHGCMAYMEYS